MDYTDYAHIKQMLDEYENIGRKKLRECQKLKILIFESTRKYEKRFSTIRQK